MRKSIFTALMLAASVPLSGEGASTAEKIALPDFKPLPAPDEAFSDQLKRIVKAAGLDEMTPAEMNPDKEDEWSSICVVDLADPTAPRVASWKGDNFVYPASTYKMYVLGEAIREVVEEDLTLDKEIIVKEHNVRLGSDMEAGQSVTVSDVLRLMIQYSDNTAANEAIDLVHRERATALLRAMGCEGSDITRKYLSRDLEDPGWEDVPGTTTNALHLATFLWAVESGAIGGGRGRGLIKSYLAMDETCPNRFRAGLPDSATLYSKTGTWNIFTSQVAIVEDGGTRFILCALTAMEEEVAEPRLAALARDVYTLLQGSATASSANQ